MNDSDESDKSPATHRRPSAEILYRLADNLRRYRHYRNYTQHELARQCGFSNSYIGDVEQGTVNITLANLDVGVHPFYAIVTDTSGDQGVNKWCRNCRSTRARVPTTTWRADWTSLHRRAGGSLIDYGTRAGHGEAPLQ